MKMNVAMVFDEQIALRLKAEGFNSLADRTVDGKKVSLFVEDNGRIKSMNFSNDKVIITDKVVF